MIQIRESITKEFVYSNEEEQLKHIEEMKQLGWTPSSQVSKNFGSVWDTDDSNRKLYTSFTKCPVGYEYEEENKHFKLYKLNDKNEYERIPEFW